MRKGKQEGARTQGRQRGVRTASVAVSWTGYCVGTLTAAPADGKSDFPGRHQVRLFMHLGATTATVMFLNRRRLGGIFKESPQPKVATSQRYFLGFLCVVIN